MRQLISGVVALACLAPTTSAQSPVEKGRTGIPLTELLKPWTGDLRGMVERRVIRVLTTYSKTQYFIDHGLPRGTAYDQGMLLEAALNEKFKTGNLRIQVQFIPVARDELLPALLEGRGDIAMGTLTVTPEREKIVDFTEPWIANVDEIVVTKPDAAAVASVDDLSGREVFVRESSSYYQSLVLLNKRLETVGKPPAVLVPAPEDLEDEDLLEMASALQLRCLCAARSFSRAP